VQNEDRFPTVRFHKCKSCGHVHAGSLTGDNSCPVCHANAEKEVAGGQIRKKMDGSHALFTVTGTLYKISELEELKAQIDEVIAQDADSIAFAFQASSFLSSSTINLLVKTMHALSEEGKPTFIITDDQDVLESLRMMDLDRVMRICPSLEQYKISLG
jgi:anti-anti-sigma factor